MNAEKLSTCAENKNTVTINIYYFYFETLMTLRNVARRGVAECYCYIVTSGRRRKHGAETYKSEIYRPRRGRRTKISTRRSSENEENPIH